MNNSVIIVNSANFVTGSQNTFKYTFPNEQHFVAGDQISLVKASIYNCVFNISTDQKNNTFSIKWIDGITANFTIRDGYYSLSDLNYYIANCMVSKNWYTSSSSTASTTTVYIYLSADSTGYGSTLTFSPLPTTTNVGTIVKPSGATWSFPTVAICPSLLLCTELQILCGFTSNSTTLPSITSGSSPITVYSNATPIVSPIDSYLLTCSLIDNSAMTIHPNVFFSIPLGGTAFGDQIQVQNSFPIFNTVRSGRYTSFTIQILDQNYNPINLLDKEVVFQFMFNIAPKL